VTKTFASVIVLTVCSVTGTQIAYAGNTKNISGSGCVEKAVKNSCNEVIDSQTGELYNLLFRSQVPKPNTPIKFIGTLHRGATPCNRGKPLDVSKWSREKGIKCPPSR